MNFEQQIAEAKRNITRFKTWKKNKMVIGISVAAVVGLGLLISNTSLRGQRNRLVDEFTTLKAKADEQIEYLSTQLDRAQSEWDDAQRQISILTAQNTELKQMATKASTNIGIDSGRNVLDSEASICSLLLARYSLSVSSLTSRILSIWVA